MHEKEKRYAEAVASAERQAQAAVAQAQADVQAAQQQLAAMQVVPKGPASPTSHTASHIRKHLQESLH